MKNIKLQNSTMITLSVLLTMALLTSCAKVSPHVEICITNDSYGFLGGLWHGIILPISWVLSLFSDDVSIYAYNNNGGWYDFGFVCGLSSLGGSANKACK